MSKTNAITKEQRKKIRTALWGFIEEGVPYNEIAGKINEQLTKVVENKDATITLDQINEEITAVEAEIIQLNKDNPRGAVPKKVDGKSVIETIDEAKEVKRQAAIATLAEKEGVDKEQKEQVGFLADALVAMERIQDRAKYKVELSKEAAKKAAWEENDKLAAAEEEIVDEITAETNKNKAVIEAKEEKAKAEGKFTTRDDLIKAEATKIQAFLRGWKARRDNLAIIAPKLSETPKHLDLKDPITSLKVGIRLLDQDGAADFPEVSIELENPNSEPETPAPLSQTVAAPQILDEYQAPQILDEDQKKIDAFKEKIKKRKQKDASSIIQRAFRKALRERGAVIKERSDEGENLGSPAFDKRGWVLGIGADGKPFKNSEEYAKSELARYIKEKGLNEADQKEITTEIAKRKNFAIRVEDSLAGLTGVDTDGFKKLKEYIKTLIIAKDSSSEITTKETSTSENLTGKDADNFKKWKETQAAKDFLAWQTDPSPVNEAVRVYERNIALGHNEWLVRPDKPLPKDSKPEPIKPSSTKKLVEEALEDLKKAQEEAVKDEKGGWPRYLDEIHLRQKVGDEDFDKYYVPGINGNVGAGFKPNPQSIVQEGQCFEYDFHGVPVAIYVGTKNEPPEIAFQRDLDRARLQHAQNKGTDKALIDGEERVSFVKLRNYDDQGNNVSQPKYVMIIATASGVTASFCDEEINKKLKGTKLTIGSYGLENQKTDGQGLDEQEYERRMEQELKKLRAESENNKEFNTEEEKNDFEKKLISQAEEAMRKTVRQEMQDGIRQDRAKVSHKSRSAKLDSQDLFDLGFGRTTRAKYAANLGNVGAPDHTYKGVNITEGPGSISTKVVVTVSGTKNNILAYVGGTHELYIGIQVSPAPKGGPLNYYENGVLKTIPHAPAGTIVMDIGTMRFRNPNVPGGYEFLSVNGSGKNSIQKRFPQQYEAYRKLHKHHSIEVITEIEGATRFASVKMGDKIKSKALPPIISVGMDKVELKFTRIVPEVVDIAKWNRDFDPWSAHKSLKINTEANALGMSHPEHPSQFLDCPDLAALFPQKKWGLTKRTRDNTRTFVGQDKIGWVGDAHLNESEEKYNARIERIKNAGKELVMRAFVMDHDGFIDGVFHKKNAVVTEKNPYQKIPKKGGGFEYKRLSEEVVKAQYGEEFWEEFSKVRVEAKVTDGLVEKQEKLRAAIWNGKEDAVQEVEVLLQEFVGRKKEIEARLKNEPNLTHAEKAKMHAKMNFDINATELDGRTALHLAAQKGYTEIVKKLLAAGADPLARNLDGKTAAEVAMKNGYKKAAEGKNPTFVDVLLAAEKAKKEQLKREPSEEMKMLQDRLIGRKAEVAQKEELIKNLVETLEALSKEVNTPSAIPDEAAITKEQAQAKENAKKDARQRLDTTYKAYSLTKQELDEAKKSVQAIEQQLNPLVAKVKKAASKPKEDKSEKNYTTYSQQISQDGEPIVEVLWRVAEVDCKMPVYINGKETWVDVKAGDMRMDKDSVRYCYNEHGETRMVSANAKNPPNEVNLKEDAVTAKRQWKNAITAYKSFVENDAKKKEDEHNIERHEVVVDICIGGKLTYTYQVVKHDCEVEFLRNGDKVTQKFKAGDVVFDENSFRRVDDVDGMTVQPIREKNALWKLTDITAAQVGPFRMQWEENVKKYDQLMTNDAAVSFKAADGVTDVSLKKADIENEAKKQYQKAEVVVDKTPSAKNVADPIAMQMTAIGLEVKGKKGSDKEDQAVGKVIDSHVAKLEQQRKVGASKAGVSLVA